MKEGIRRSLAAVMAAAIVGGAGLPAGIVTGLSGASSLTASAWEVLYLKTAYSVSAAP